VDDYFLETPAGGEVLLVVADGLQEHILEHDHNTLLTCPRHPNSPLWLKPHDEATFM
jgi:hypothetical protein